MAKKTQVDRAIDALQAEIKVLELAVAKLREQQAKATKRKARVAATFGPADVSDR